jgi:alkanesulfonate monooxygenase
MSLPPRSGPPEIFSTCPPWDGGDGRAFRDRIAAVARWSEAAGCRGILVYSDNAQADPWLVAQIVIGSTRALCPLVAVQPVYMHPYTVAKLVASLGALYGRRVYLNMVAGGFKNDLNALDDPTPHDRRYQRLSEYATVIVRLLEGSGPIRFAGEFYRLEKAGLKPGLPPGLMPGFFVSGSSAAGLEAARALAATAIRYPKPAGDPGEAAPPEGVACGIRVGIISRTTESEAWEAARLRFPEDRRGRLAHQLAMKVSDSAWHRQLSDLAREEGASPYWLVPFENYKTMCPYLVGSYERVAQELRAYIALGSRTFILDVPHDAEDLLHARRAFDRAGEAAA